MEKISTVGELRQYLRTLPDSATIQAISTNSDLRPIDEPLTINDEISYDSGEGVLLLCI